MDYNNSSRRFKPWGSRVIALSIKCDSLALRTESREEWIFSSGINCMSVWEWLERERKCSETVQEYRRSPNLRDLLVKAQLPVSQTIIFRQTSSAVDEIVPLVHTLLTASQVIPFTLQVKHAPSLHTLLVTLKTWSTWFNVTFVIYNIWVKLSDVSRTDLTNTGVQLTKRTLNLNPLLFHPRLRESFRFQVSSVQLVRMKVYKNHPCARARVLKWMVSSFSL